MKKKKFKMGILSLIMFPLLMFSCVEGYDDDAVLDLSLITDTQMVTPSETEMTRIESMDGRFMYIEWPFAYGAGGYEVKYAVIDVNNEIEEVIHDYAAYDGNSIIVSVMEDTRYLFSIKTLGNPKYNNADAENTTVFIFGTAYELIHHFAAGEDVTAYFEANPVPQVDYGIKYTFEPGAEYTISSRVDFGLSRVMLCSSVSEIFDPSVRPKIHLENSGFTTDGAGVKIKDLNFTYTGTNYFLRFRPMNTGEVFADHPKIDANGWVTTYDPIVLQSCNIDTYALLNDGAQKYAAQTFYVKDCVISFNASQQMVYFTQMVLKDLMFENSTFWGKGTGSNYFIRYNHSNRISANALWTWSLSQTWEFKYCTFYNCAKTHQFLNGNGINTTSGGIANKSTATYCIFVDCGNGEVIRRLRAGGTNIGITCLYNSYWYDGAFASKELATNYDSSGTAIQSNPELEDPANGDFTVRGMAQRGFTGDPRWWW